MDQLNRVSTSNPLGNPEQQDLSMDSLQSDATIAPKRKVRRAASTGAVYPTYTFQSPHGPVAPLPHQQQYAMPQTEYPQPQQYQRAREEPAQLQPQPQPQQYQRAREEPAQPQPPQQPQQQPHQPPMLLPPQEQQLQQQRFAEPPNQWKPEQQNEQVPHLQNNAGAWGGPNTEYVVPPTAPLQQQQQQQQQQQHHHFFSHHGQAPAAAAAHGPQPAHSQPNMHMQFANAPISHFVPGEGHNNNPPAPAPPKPPTTTARSEHSHSMRPRPNARPHTLWSCLRDGLSNITIVELAPISTLATAAFLHHYRHRHATDFIPYKAPKWVKYIKNTMYAYSSYRFLINNGIIHKDSLRNAISGSPLNVGAHTIQSGAFHRPKRREHGTRALHDEDDEEALDTKSDFTFDPRHAIPKSYAKDYYRHVYAEDADLRHTPAYVLAGAAAIRALRNEAHTLAMLAEEEPHLLEELDVEHMAMGMAIAEAEECLARKQQQHGRKLTHNNTIDFVGPIALATMGKIREDKRLKAAGKSSTISEYSYDEAEKQGEPQQRQQQLTMPQPEIQPMPQPEYLQARQPTDLSNTDSSNTTSGFSHGYGNNYSHNYNNGYDNGYGNPATTAVASNNNNASNINYDYSHGNMSYY
ncbi:hypothetical protein EV175_002640 [Coemansia sp. RSA 1933]|nr:hypothetical protein EV175_002640 [Coemansia sp. RSA 1933]